MRDGKKTGGGEGGNCIGMRSGRLASLADKEVVELALTGGNEREAMP